MGLRIVDSDAHVVENINTFSHIDPRDSKYTPLLLNQAWGPARVSKDGNVGQSYWLIDGNVYARGFNVNHQHTTEGQREMTDIAFSEGECAD